MLQETKRITDKSLSLVKDPDSGHMAEVEELLSKDKRYVSTRIKYRQLINTVCSAIFRYMDMEPLADARAEILTTYLEELERRGPPPPPTASEPGRRSKL